MRLRPIGLTQRGSGPPIKSGQGPDVVTMRRVFDSDIAFEHPRDKNRSARVLKLPCRRTRRECNVLLHHERYTEAVAHLIR